MIRNDLITVELQQHREAEIEQYLDNVARFGDNTRLPYRLIEDTKAIAKLREAWTEKIGAERVDEVSIVAFANQHGYTLSMYFAGWQPWLQLDDPDNYVCRVVPRMDPVEYKTTDGDRLTQVRNALLWIKRLYVPRPYVQEIYHERSDGPDCWYVTTWIYEFRHKQWCYQRWRKAYEHGSIWRPCAKPYWMEQ